MENIDLSSIRREYQLKELSEKEVNPDPVVQLKSWLDEAMKSKVYEPTAMHLATVGSNHRPSSRIVLLKGLSESGLSFFTNYHSKKGKEIFSQPFGAVTFFWPELERQVRVEGIIEKTSREISEKYFHSRPRGSQLSAITSAQSTVISGRAELINIKNQLEVQYKDKDLPCPENWGGYILQPDYFEFWQGRQDRLHDRIIYEKNEKNWDIKRLAP